MRSRRKERTSSLAGSNAATYQPSRPLSSAYGSTTRSERLVRRLVVLEPQQALLVDRAETRRAMSESSAVALAMCSCSRGSSPPSALTIFSRAVVERAGRQVLADEVDRGDERLRLDGQQARGAGEVVGVGLGVDLDRPVLVQLGVEHVRPAAEGDDVEDVDVLLQLLGARPGPARGRPPRAASSPRRPASMRMLASVTRRAKRSGRIDVSRRPPRSLPSLAAPSSCAVVRGAWPRARARSSPVWRSCEQLDALGDLVGQLRRREHARVLAQPEDERRELAAVGVRRREDDRAVVLLADLAEAAEVPLDLPRDPLRDPDLGGAHRLAELPLGAVGVDARVEVGGPLEVVLGLRRVGDLAADARRGGRRGSRRARASARRGRTGRPGRAGGTGRPCAAPTSPRCIE